MPIPLGQLETWSHLGATANSSLAYARIRDAIFKEGSPVRVSEENVYLQGSYTNSTNIYGDSDVDVVVLYEDTFHKDMLALSTDDQARHEATFPQATYRWADLRDDVIKALRGHFGNDAVTQGKKSIKVKTAQGRLPSDVVPVVQFRRYATFRSRTDLTAHWGIAFFDTAGNQIVNYPKYHIQRGEEKNSAARTAGQYKKTIRVFKNLRNHMVDRGHIADKKVAPSYFIECALHNFPDNLFVGNLDETVPKIINFLRTAPHQDFKCQNGVTKLIGNSTTEWPEANYVAFANGAQTAWDNYYA